jgi:chaperonin GroEL (HSP60 family)
MANMSYCRFENTRSDVNDCKEAIEEFFYDEEEISDGERQHAAWMLEDMIEMLGSVAEHEGKAIGELVTEAYDSVDVSDFFKTILDKHANS